LLDDWKRLPAVEPQRANNHRLLAHQAFTRAWNGALLNASSQIA
jgi:hypothetical protein